MSALVCLCGSEVAVSETETASMYDAAKDAGFYQVILTDCTFLEGNHHFNQTWTGWKPGLEQPSTSVSIRPLQHPQAEVGTP